MPRSDALVPAAEACLSLDQADPELRALAAWHGALGAGVPAVALCTLAVGLAPLAGGLAHGLFAAALPGMLAAVVTEAAGIGVAALLALPVAALAARQVKVVGRSSRDQAVATAAGIGMATFVTTGLGVLWHAGSLVALADAGVAAVGAILATGIVGGAAFGAVPARRGAETAMPALYQGLGAAGASAGSLMVLAGVVDHLSLAFPVLDAPRMALYMAMPHPLGDLASVAVIMATMAPLTGLVTRAIARQMPDAPKAAVGAGVAATVLSPVVSFVTVALAMAATAPAAAVAHAAGAAGALLGALPNLVAVAWGLRGHGRKRLPEG